MFTKLCRIGNEPTIRFTPGESSTAVLNLSLAYSYGRKGDDGKYPTQWIDASLWGKQAESAEKFLNKGDQIAVSIQDLHLETFTGGKNGGGTKMVGRIVAFDFVSGNKEQNSQPESKPQKQAESPPASKSSFDNFDDDIPF